MDPALKTKHGGPAECPGEGCPCHRPNTMEEGLRREDDWPHWPVLPVKRLPWTGGLVLAPHMQQRVVPGSVAVVFEANLFLAPKLVSEWAALPRHEYESWTAATAAGWSVD